VRTPQALADLLSFWSILLDEEEAKGHEAEDGCATVSVRIYNEGDLEIGMTE